MEDGEGVDYWDQSSGVGERVMILAIYGLAVVAVSLGIGRHGYRIADGIVREATTLT